MGDFLSGKKKYILLAVGSTIYALGFSLFFIPNKIVTGGLLGIGNIIYHITSFPPGLTSILLNVVLTVIGFRILGKTAIIDALLSNGLISVLLDIFIHFPVLTDDVLLASIFGAVLYGIGAALCFMTGASTGGTDTLARIIQYNFPNAPIGKILMIVNGSIVFCSLLVFQNTNICLYSIIGMYIGNVVVDTIIQQMNTSVCIFVVTEKGEEVCKTIQASSTRGITMYDAVGAYTNMPKQVLMCAMKSNEIEKFQKQILAIDSGAFMIFAEADHILGKGFHYYK